MSSQFPSQNPVAHPADPEEVLKLTCPACSGVLNLRRKHMGIEGKCVHCAIPVIAEESGGQASLRLIGAPEPSPAAQPEPTPEPEVEEAKPTLEMPELSPPREESAPASAGGSTWGFPNRDENSAADDAAVKDLLGLGDTVAEGKPSEEPMKDVNSASDPLFPKEPESFPSSGAEPMEEEMKSEPLAELPSMTEPAIAMPEEEEPAAAESEVEECDGDSGAEEDAPSFADTPNFGGSMLDDEGLLPSAASSALFGGGDSTSPASERSSDEEGGINTGWGTKVPTQNHASISPFSTGSAHPDPGFAETLFKEGESVPASHIEAKSPFGEAEGAPAVGGALFADPVEKVDKPEGDEEVVLDGDGRPMKPMTEEEKEAFAKEMMQVGEFHKRPKWFLRLRKFVVTMIVLGGLGYAAYVFMPQDKVEEWKAQALDWLEPGSVLLDFLPFELEDVPEGEGG